MRFGSVCSGIEAATVAWKPLGWEAAWLSEIEAFPSAVLKHHYPTVPNLGDMSLLPDRVLSGEIEAPDILCGGCPCQSFSVAGAKRSLSDSRGNLTLIFCELANSIDIVREQNELLPSIIFYENVPGILSTKDNAFGCFLAGLAGESMPLVPSGKKWTNSGVVFGPQRTVAWRVLDAQYFGLAQRRKRVFVVASARSGFDPSAILFEYEGMRRDIAPSRKSREDITETITRSTNSGGVEGSGESIGGYDQPSYGIPGNWINRKPENGGNAVEPMHNVAPCLTKTDQHAVAYALQGTMIGRSDNAGPQGSGIGEDISFTLTKADQHGVVHPVAYSFDSLSSNSMKSSNPLSGCNVIDVAKTLDTSCLNPACNQGGVAISQMAVRRLTPTECERLQGFPDSYTKIPWRGKPIQECPDGPRYKAIGNSWAVPVVRWIGQRIDNAVSNATYIPSN